MFYAGFTSIGSWEGRKNFGVGIFLNKKLVRVGLQETNKFLLGLRPLQFNYLSYKLFWGKKFCQTPKKKKEVDFGVLQTKVVKKFSGRLKKR